MYALLSIPPPSLLCSTKETSVLVAGKLSGLGLVNTHSSRAGNGCEQPRYTRSHRILNQLAEMTSKHSRGGNKLCPVH